MTSLLLAAWLFIQGGASAGSAVITGRILTPDGKPMVGVRVAAVPVEGTGRGETVETFAAIAETDSRGRYRLDLSAGRYYVRAGLVELPTYYPGVATLTEARMITVDRNSSVADVDFNISQTVGVRISGRVVLDPRQAPLSPDTQISLAQGAPFIADVPLKPDGTFEFVRVAPGTTYSVVLRGIAGVRNIAVADRDVTNVVVNVPLHFEISARLVVEGGWLPSDRTNVIFNGKRTGGALFDGTSTAKLRLAPDDYRVVPWIIPPGRVVKSIRYGSIDLLQEPFSVPPKESNEIVVTLGVSP